MRRFEKRGTVAERERGEKLAIMYSVIEGVAEARYGVEVISLTSGESERIDAITACSRCARELLDKMARCAVTPATARDVVHDWLHAEGD
ncbi:MAG: DUF6514 family protein [Oscillospiraceae bacterium]|nr:DUF6514 family protein [Oscillospiraceae bacterium]